MWSLWREAEWEAAQASTITKTATALERGLLCLASDCGTFEPFRLSQTAQSVAGVTISNSQSDRLVRDGTSLFHAVIRCALPVNRQQASQLFYMCPSPSISDEKSSGAVSLVNQTNPTGRSLVLLEAWVGDRVFVCMPSSQAESWEWRSPALQPLLLLSGKHRWLSGFCFAMPPVLCRFVLFLLKSQQLCQRFSKFLCDRLCDNSIYISWAQTLNICRPMLPEVQQFPYPVDWTLKDRGLVYSE